LASGEPTFPCRAASGDDFDDFDDDDFDDEFDDDFEEEWEDVDDEDSDFDDETERDSANVRYRQAGFPLTDDPNNSWQLDLRPIDRRGDFRRLNCYGYSCDSPSAIANDNPRLKVSPSTRFDHARSRIGHNA